MNPLIQLLIQESPAIIAALRHKAPTGTTSEEIIAAWEKLFHDSDAKDAFLLAALNAEIAAKGGTTPV